MSSADLDIERLSDSEKAALETYTAVTGQEPSEAIPLLRRSQWNIQVCHGAANVGSLSLLMNN